ncbi:CBS domain-containing protein [Marinobacter bryozoorum]|uniref:CBS domain-containing protein n=1 Tax=Marinobacter bryozoorum TaxID=256324 RepID=UPI002004F852|nr:CBS domain-containing protein [Marinobacter bryozoorum]MCK7543643.1 CBS domain-containing protein [Marinobacter bryozoorum]
MRTVEDLMSKWTPALHERDYLSRAVDQILSSGHTGLPVVDDNNRLVGFLSEQDCIRSLASSSYHCDNWVRISDIMSRNPVSVTPEMSELALANLFSGQRPKVYPVVDKNNRVLGVLTRSRVMAALNDQLKACRVA